MKLVKSIVDNDYRLIGFKVEGKSKEFGGIGNDTVLNVLSMNGLKGFNNEQVRIGNDGSIQCKKVFNLYDLDMELYANGVLTPVKNGMELVRRVLVNGEIKGYDVKFSGELIKRCTYDNVIRYAAWCKPMNFMVKNTDTKRFISGKGMRLSDLPEVEIGNDDTKKGKGKRSNYGGEKKSKLRDKMIQAKGDLIGLYEIINSCNGVIIKLPDEVYKATGERKEKVAEEFKSLGIGEIGSAYIDFGEKKLNANTTFKNVGIVMVNSNGMPMPIYTFTYSTKSIFVDGRNHMDKFGIGVTSDVVKGIVDRYGSGLVVEEIKDVKMTKPISSILGREDLVYFKVDTSNLSIMSKDDVNKYILSTVDLYKNVSKLAILKAQNKVIKDGIKRLKENGYDSGDKPLYGLLAGLNSDALRAVEEAGIDVHSGAYIKREKVEDNDSKDTKEVIKSNSLTESIEIEYNISGNNITKLNYQYVLDTIAGKVEKHKLCDDQLLKIVGAIEKAPRDNKVALAEACRLKIDKDMRVIKYKLWLHKVASYTIGNSQYYKVNMNEWAEKVSRAKKGKTYICKASGCDGLEMKVSGIELG